MTLDMITWIDRQLALAIHERQLAEHGGSAGVRNEALLDSALARPQQLFVHGDPPPDLAALAASLAFGLVRDQPFVDGKKHTAAVACQAFLLLNHAVLDATDAELFPVDVALSEGSIDEAGLAAWLRPRLHTQSDDAAHEPRRAYFR